jgi:hypothetical protein
MNDNELHPIAMQLTELVRLTHHAAVICTQVQTDLYNNPARIELANARGVAATQALAPEEQAQTRSVTIAALASVVATTASSLVGYDVATGKAQRGSLTTMIAAIALAAHQLIESNTHQAMQLNELVGENDAHN